MTDKDKAPAAITEFGFQFGAALVERCADWGKGKVLVKIKTPKQTIDVYVTKTGKVRIYTGGMEMQSGKAVTP